MAEQRPGGEPTEQPTPKRLKDARRKGQVAKSRDFSGCLTFWAAFAALTLTIPMIVGRVMSLARFCLSPPDHGLKYMATASLFHGMTQCLYMLSSILVAAMLAAVIAGFVQTRGLLTLEPLKPKLGNLNPLNGLKNLVSKQNLFTALKTVIVFAACGTVAYLSMKQLIPLMLRTAGAAPRALASTLWEGTERLSIRVGLLFVVCGAADYAYQYFRHRKKLMMTKYEVQKEFKESEGDPQHKSRRRELHQEISQHAMVESVGQADFVVVNPVRLAVAMRYRPDRESSPRVMAKGQHMMAEKIRSIARKAGVPIFTDVPLARALWELELNQEIPEPLYEAVAAILRVVMESRND